MDQRLIKKLQERQIEGSIRQLRPFPADFIDFSSNDYLGLAKASVNLLSAGGMGSRLISGTTSTVLKSELELARFFKAEAALMFNSGYDANLGFFSCIPQRGDTVLYDALIHASIRDGIRLSNARAFAFAHNDLNSLEMRLKQAEGTVYVAVESLYSMDGDCAPLEAIVRLCGQYRAWLVVDEAHAAGIFGEEGRGLALDFSSDFLLARLVTFGKAYGSHGACWLGSESLIQYLSNYARSFIYTTALPEGVYAHNAATVVDTSLSQARKDLGNVLTQFHLLTPKWNLNSHASSPIQVLEIGGIVATKRIEMACHAANLGVKAILSPTVKEGSERIRICLHAFNTQTELERLVETISSHL